MLLIQNESRREIAGSKLYIHFLGNSRTSIINWSAVSTTRRMYTFQLFGSVPSYPSSSPLTSHLLTFFAAKLPQIDTPGARVRPFSACLSCLRVSLKEAKADYREPMLFTIFVDWVFVKVEKLCAAAPSSVKEFLQLVIPGSDPDLYHGSAVCAKLNTSSNGRNF